MNHGEHGITLSAKIRVDAKHKTHHHTINAIPAQIISRYGNNRRIIREYSRQRLRQELRVHANRKPKNQRHPDTRVKTTIHSGDQFRPVILSGHRGHRRRYCHRG